MLPPTEMTCQELVEIVTDYSDGTLTLTERALFEQHLADRDDCPVYLDQIRQTIILAGALTEELITPAAKEELPRRFHNWANEEFPATESPPVNQAMEAHRGGH